MLLFALILYLCLSGTRRRNSLYVWKKGGRGFLVEDEDQKQLISSSVCMMMSVCIAYEPAHALLQAPLINPRRMREGYGTCSVIRSFVHSFIRSVHRAAETIAHF